MIYYIADPHFGHNSIINMCGRPFSSLEEMDQIMIDNWNHRVKGNDTVYVIGDMFYHCAPDRVSDILSQLRGRKALIIGNHDGSWLNKMPKETLSHYFFDITMMTEINDGHRVLTLCHYPMLTWRRQKKSYMVYGHIHNDTSMDFWPLIMARDHMLNAGVEINFYMPVTFDELVANNAAFHAHLEEEKYYNGYGEKTPSNAVARG